MVLVATDPIEFVPCKTSVNVGTLEYLSEAITDGSLIYVGNVVKNNLTSSEYCDSQNQK